MKLTKLIFLFALTLATVSCSKDDDNNDPYKLTTTNFVDTYKLKSFQNKEVETLTFGNGTTSTSTTSTEGSVFQNVNYLFNSNNTYKASGSYITIKTVKKADGTTTVEEPFIVNLDESGVYSLDTSNKKLTLTKEDGTIEAFDISKYNETEMRLYSEVKTTSNNSTTTTTTEYRFSR